MFKISFNPVVLTCLYVSAHLSIRLVNFDLWTNFATESLLMTLILDMSDKVYVLQVYKAHRRVSYNGSIVSRTRTIFLWNMNVFRPRVGLLNRFVKGFHRGTFFSILEKRSLQL